MKAERFGNYVLVQLLGKGGMAEVFLARAQSLGGFEKLLAIKRLLPPYNIDQHIIAMLGDEARLSVWLNHPNIVQVLDFGRVGQTYYIAMEYVQGCDLCDLIRPDGVSPGRSLPLPTALYVMIQVADALDYAHTRRNLLGEPLRIVHRDVSPHNVLISEEGQVKLADFGLARASISIHHSAAGVIRGKFSYMPKEQARGKAIDHRVDLFAAGVTLYEVLTGVKPYTATTLAQQLYQLEKPVPPPSAHLSSIPEEIDAITMRAMSPDPETRYATAEELSRDLRRAMAQRSSFGEEADRLADLVCNMGSSSPGSAPLPVMSLADVRVPEGSLIDEELRAAQRAAREQVLARTLAPSRTAWPGEPPGLPDDEEEGATVRVDSPPSPGLPPSPGRPPASTGPLPRTSPMPTAGPVRSANDDSLDGLGGEASDSGAAVNPGDTVVDEGPARLERALHRSDDLDNVRTTQREPEEARAAFRHALDERERRKRRQRRREQREASRLGLRSTLILGAGGIVLFGIGVGLGWLLRHPSPGPSVPLSAICSEVHCPPCARQTALRDSAPGQTAVAPSRVDAAGSTPLPGSAEAGGASGSGPESERPSRRGFLTVSTNGAPARVYVDAAPKAMPAPVVRLPLSAGAHRVRIYSEQHRTFSETQWVTIRVGQTATLTFSLE